MKLEINNYPVKYALMPIYEECGNSYNRYGDRSEELVAYIATKCYVIKEIRTYNPDGSSSNSYEVVFSIDANDVEYSKEPDYNYNRAVINSNIVTSIYDTLEEALISEEHYNKELIAILTSCYPLKNVVAEIKYANERINGYKEKIANTDYTKKKVRY